MQAIKNFVSGKSTDETQSGREPASGQTGAGTASEPYDAGNTTGNSSLEGSAPSESSYGSTDTNVGSTLGSSTLGSSDTNTGGSENTFARDRGGPTPGNKGPHLTSIANKLDPNVDSDGDGKPRAGPSDIEHATVGGLSTTTGQLGSTGGYSSNTTGSSSNYDNTSNTSSYGSNTAGETAGEAPSSGYASSATDGNTSRYDNYTSSVTGDRSSTTTSDVPANDRTSTQQSSSTAVGSGPYTSGSNYGGQEDLSRSTGVNVTDGIRPEHQTDKTGVTSMHSNDPKFSDERLTSSHQSSVEDRGQTRAPVGGFGTVEPSVGADVSSGATHKQKEQGADRPLDEPTGHQLDAVKGEKETTERQQDGGDASGAQQHGPVGGKTSEGTGEQWVKSSGVAAEGGDFDAAKPGAGREADRLMEQGGVHRDPGPGKVDTGASGSVDSADKPSMGQKIMEKMHIG